MQITTKYLERGSKLTASQTGGFSLVVKYNSNLTEILENLDFYFNPYVIKK